MSEGGTIALVDRAHPSRLGDLVRALRHRWPDVDVFTDVRDLDALPPGSLFVLSPKAEDAELLNLRRQIFADRRFKVVLWCDEATTVALARKAVDFFDWITHRQECPSGPAPFAVRGLRAAFQAEWPVVWRGSERNEDLDEVLRAAFPTEKVLWVNGADPYDRLVEYMSSPKIVVVRVQYARALRRVRWAYAEAKRKGRLILIAPGLDCPGFWPVHDWIENLAVARTKLMNAGVNAPGTLAALWDLEPEAIELCVELLQRDPEQATLDTRDVADAATESIEPTAGLAPYLAHESSKGSAEWVYENPIALRIFSGRQNAKHAFAERLRSIIKGAELPSQHRNVGLWVLHSTSIFSSRIATLPPLRAWAMEPVLRAGPQQLTVFVALAVAASTLGEPSLATRWLSQLQKGLWIFKNRLLAIMQRLAQRNFRTFLTRARDAETPTQQLEYLHKLIAEIESLRINDRPYDGLLFLRYERDQFDELRLEFAQASDPTIDEQVRDRTLQEILIRASRNLGAEHPVYEEVARFLAQLMLTTGRPREAWDTVKPLLWPDRELPPELALLTARILARTGRASDAVQVLARLTGQSIAPTSTLLPSPATQSADGEPSLEQLLQCPAGALAKDPDAFLALVDALLSQGRYPEALHIARKATATFVDGKTPAIAELRARVADLERRRG